MIRRYALRIPPMIRSHLLSEDKGGGVYLLLVLLGVYPGIYPLLGRERNSGARY